MDTTHGQGRANQAVTGTVAYPGKQGLSGGGESWSSLTTMILQSGGAPYVVWPRGKNDYDAATPVIQDLLNKNDKFVAVSGIGLLSPGNTGQLHDGGPSAARTALAYAKQKDEMYIFEAATTPRTTFRTSSAGWAVIRRSCSTAAGRRRLCCAATPGACGRARARHGDRATPGRFSVIRMSARCPAGWPSISLSR